ncbi:MAG: hypothetical protein Q9170_001777 [Blastenia crenularia]
MDKSAARQKPNLKNLSPQRYEPPMVHGDILSRIRSLFASHDEKRPPLTPSPTPASAHTAANSDEEETGISFSRAADLGRGYTKFSSFLVANQELFASNYDGPAGQITDPEAEGSRRRSTQRGTNNDLRAEGDGQSFSTAPRGTSSNPFGRSHRSLKEPPREANFDGPRRVRSNLSKAPTNPRRSLYSLKATSSADSQPHEKKSKRPFEEPNLRMNHVPGSFRSEYDASIQDSRSPSIADTDRYETVTVDPIQGRSFETISSRGVSLNEAPVPSPDLKEPSAVTSGIVESNEDAIPVAVVPFLPPTLSSQSLGQTSSIAPSQIDLVPQPTSLQSVIDKLEGQPLEELVKAVEASSDQALAPDLGTQNAVAAVDFQTRAAPSTPGVPMINNDTPRKGMKQPAVGEPATTPFEDIPLSDEQSHARQVAPPETVETKRATIEKSLPELSPSPVESGRNTLPLSAPVPQAPIRSATSPEQSASSTGSPPFGNPEIESNASWVRQLLGRKSAPAMGQAPPNLTARPHHRSRKVIDDVNLQRSNTLPAQTNSVVADQDQPKGPETFARVITDLEGLLQQALQIAGQANDKTTESAPSRQPVPRDQGSKQQLRNAADRETSYESSNSSDEETSSDSTGLDEEQNRTTVPRRYTDSHGTRITVVESGEADRYHTQFKSHRHGTPYPSALMRSSRTPTAVVETEDGPRNQNSANKRSGSLAVPGQRIGNRDIASGISQHPMHITIQGDPADVQNVLLHPVGVTTSSVDTADWALKRQPTSAISQEIGAGEPQNAARRGSVSQLPMDESQGFVLRERKPSKTPGHADTANASVYSATKSFSPGDDKESIAYFSDRPPSQMHKRGASQRKNVLEVKSPTLWEDKLSPLPSDIGGRGPNSDPKSLDLKHRHHFSIREPKMFSLSHSHRRSPVARDWSTSKKRWVALVACINTALMGLIIGIYAGEVPAIQYNIVDEHHYTILGNVVLFIGLAITTSIFWPLPLLYGRKPFTLAALAILVPLQFPQAVAVSGFRTPYTPTYRVALLLSRAIAGLVMGFANINFIATLLDLFGASLQSVNPHQEVVNVNDVRRHGGGMGIWLGVWTWCFIGSIGVGFFIGAVIISGLAVDWGFWITIIVTAFVLVLNVLVPEVRRSQYRRSVAEVRTPTELSRRVARGEVKMHLYSTGPKWWIEEVIAGSALCIRMLKQPGFMVLSIYIGWIYGQIVMVIVLLGALTSRYYRFRPQYVGLCVLAIPIGALLAVPFQRASVLSRSRQKPPRTDSMTVNKRLTWTSHFVRRAIFMVSLPFAGLAYTLASVGPQVSVAAPTVFAGLIGFLSNLAIAECNGIIMETWDTSDLQPGMTGRPRRDLPEEVRKKRTNFSSFPRVTAAFAISQTCAFLIAAAATGAGGVIERRLGAQAATAVVAGILLILTLLLIAVVTRFKETQIIPSQRYGTNVLSGPEDEWKPVIIGNPSGTTRRMSILELGNMTRWKEIRRRNRLTGLEGY